VSVLGTFYARAGLSIALSPPRLSGIYYDSMAVYNALTPAFTVQNGVDQSTLAGQTAQLFPVPTTASAMQLQAAPEGAPYGAYLGPINTVWFEPPDTPGSFPVTLGALAGQIQWTPEIEITDGSAPIFVVPGAACYAIVFSATPADPTAVVYVNGVQSGKIVGASNAPGSSQSLIQLEAGTGDTIFQITSTAPFNAIVSLVVGDAPLINAAQTIGSQQILVGSGGPEVGGTDIVVNTNPLWRAIFVAILGTGPFATPTVAGSTGLTYEATMPPYLVPSPNQALWRFHLLTGVDTAVTIGLPPGGTMYWWGADFADVDVEAYNSSGGDIGMANSPDPLRFSYAGDLVAGTSASTDIPGGYVSCPAGSTAFLTRLWGKILGGTSVDVTVRVNSYPAYAGPVDVPGLDPITITTTDGGFVLPSPLQVFDLDYVDIVLSSLVATPAGLAALVDVIAVPG
jgi:hypothetical protein